jgi:hypothetical protein
VCGKIDLMNGTIRDRMSVGCTVMPKRKEINDLDGKYSCTSKKIECAYRVRCRQLVASAIIA